MSRKFIYIALLLFALSSCNKSGKNNYEIYVWRAFYNPTESPLDDYTVNIESDTLINNHPIGLSPTDKRFILYQNLDSIRSEAIGKSSDSFFLKVDNDSIFVYGDMTKGIWYEKRSGILKINFTHSRNPGWIRSYELIRKIQFHNGIKSERNFDSVVSSIDKVLHKESDKILNLLKQQNE